MDYGKMNMSELIEARKNNNSELHDANKIVSALKAEEDLIDAAIIAKLEADGTKRAASDLGSVSMQVEEVPEVIDWEAFYEYIHQNKDFALLQRRATSTAMRELWKLGQTVPGVTQRTVKRVNYRSS